MHGDEQDKNRQSKSHLDGLGGVCSGNTPREWAENEAGLMFWKRQQQTSSERDPGRLSSSYNQREDSDVSPSFLEGNPSALAHYKDGLFGIPYPFVHDDVWKRSYLAGRAFFIGAVYQAVHRDPHPIGKQFCRPQQYSAFCLKSGIPPVSDKEAAAFMKGDVYFSFISQRGYDPLGMFMAGYNKEKISASSMQLEGALWCHQRGGEYRGYMDALNCQNRPTPRFGLVGQFFSAVFNPKMKSGHKHYCAEYILDVCRQATGQKNNSNKSGAKPL